MKTPKEVLLEWAEAFNSHDAKAAAELYEDDATNIQIAIGKPLLGKAAIYQDLKYFFETIPDTYTKIENLFEDGEWGIIEWSGGGTYQPTARKGTLRGCGFFHIPNGKIKFQRGYWDKAEWFKQLGIPLD